MRDVEAATTPVSAQKKRKMCLIFGIVVMTWFCVLMYIISGVKAPDRQSYMDNLDFKANNAATPNAYPNPHPHRHALLPEPPCSCRLARHLTHTLTLALALTSTPRAPTSTASSAWRRRARATSAARSTRAVWRTPTSRASTSAGSRARATRPSPTRTR